jgi:RHH-type proline utilization regulon transcriptional repressor/proline dehydrogenase/delta 1-pyrroline-5-carboxylate dehydrogenase
MNKERAERLPHPGTDETRVVQQLLATLDGALDWPAAAQAARPWVQAVRDHPAPFWAMESLLREYPISSAEGLALMRLAEALLRVPDAETAVALTADQLGKAAFDGKGHEAHGAARSEAAPHRLLASLSASALNLSKKLLPESERGAGVFMRLGAQTVVAATVRAIQLLGRQFVLGRNIREAMDEAQTQRRDHAGAAGADAMRGHLRFSYDMLGEGARTEAAAMRYLASYRSAIEQLAASNARTGPEDADGISIKLSALFSRYEDAQRERVFGELLPRIWQLAELAAPADINLTIDAEESERLELSLDVFEALAQRIATTFPRWRGFGLAVQAYQTRALPVIDEVARIARANRLRFMVRLAKGAYWDSEIKRAQELGLSGYAVFTHKHHTDISYLACARALIGHAEALYPQFATHNAGTIAAIVQMARAKGAAFEMQRLHGMGEGIYREVSRRVPAQPGSLQAPVPVRVYAPVGEHRDLLAYLVRRLLENGANTSFVHQLSDEAVDIETLLASPLNPARQPAIALPVSLYGWDGARGRRNSAGVDLSCLAERKPLEVAVASTVVEPPTLARDAQIDVAMARLEQGFVAWNATPVGQRAHVLRRAADALEARLPEFCGLLVKEAQKTLGDCVSEVREAVDFCRYYAEQAEQRLADQVLPGPTGESNRLHLRGRGVFVCISPWNFPLAIFAGQVAAALVAGNAVAAKPAEQTPAIAARFVELLHRAGVPTQALALLHGPGETVGAALVADGRTAGVCFTGSTAVARIINRTLAAKDGAIVPLIAETGGINAMIVDSTALPEQVVDAVVQSAFRSAGQRCSALRLLCVHDSVADGIIEMIRGALLELRVDDPALLATDVGPLIDNEAYEGIRAHTERLRREAKLIGESPLSSTFPLLVAPIAFEVPSVSAVQQEIFGPVLHVLRWDGALDALVAQINALGYGLTLGLQTRIDGRALRLAAAARAGNVYVNRNMIGAVVGVQPFGGEGLSGTGPKAGGPHYLHRFCSEQVVTINTAAAGGNAALLAGLH